MRRNDKKAAELQRLELFKSCGKRELRLLASLAEDIAFVRGDTLCEEGRFAYECFVIRSGSAEVRVHDQAIAVVGPGDVVGEMALLDGGRRAATVVALTDIQTFAIERRQFGALLERAPVVAKAMLSQLAARLRHVDDELATAAANGA